MAATAQKYDAEGTMIGTVDLPDALFGCEPHGAALHAYTKVCRTNQRQGTVKTKTRAEVAGGGAKPWRQKGTGRARAGTIRSPIWTGGGTTFASRPRDYTQKINRKMYRAAMRSILSELVRQERLVAVESIGVDAPKTKELAGKLAELGLDKVLIVTDAADDNLYLAARNLPGVAVCDVASADPVSLVGFDKVLMTTAALGKIEERLS